MRPVESASTSMAVQRVYKETECSEPSRCEYQVERPNSTTGQEEPKQAAKDGQCGKHLGEYKPLPGPSMSMVEVMKVGSDDASYDLNIVSLCRNSFEEDSRRQIAADQCGAPRK